MAVFQRQEAGDVWEVSGTLKASSQPFSEGEGKDLLKRTFLIRK
jgi:hypothetical protein